MTAINLMALLAIFTSECCTSSLFNETEGLQFNATPGFNVTVSSLFNETGTLQFNNTSGFSAPASSLFNETEGIIQFNAPTAEFGNSSVSSTNAPFPANVTSALNVTEEAVLFNYTNFDFLNETLEEEGEEDNGSQWSPSNTNQSIVAQNNHTFRLGNRTHRHSGYANDTTGGLLLTLVDDYDVPCLKMLLNIMSTVYFTRNQTNYDVWQAAYFPPLPTSYNDVSIEGDCGNNATALIQISWAQHLLTWSFVKEQTDNVAWNLTQLTLVIGDTDWFQKYNFCESPCEPFVFSSYHKPLIRSFNNSYEASELTAIHLKHNETALMASVFLIKDQFKVETFLGSESD